MGRQCSSRGGVAYCSAKTALSPANGYHFYGYWFDNRNNKNWEPRGEGTNAPTRLEGPVKTAKADNEACKPPAPEPEEEEKKPAAEEEKKDERPPTKQKSSEFKTTQATPTPPSRLS